VSTFKIVPSGKSRQLVVEYDSSTSTVTCSCKNIEFVGILCAYALKVLSLQNFKRVHDHYILKRWIKDAKSR